MPSLKKAKRLLKLTKDIPVKRKLVFSDEGNLKSVRNIDNYERQIKWYKPYGLWYSWGNIWLNYLLAWDDWWGNDRAKTYTHAYEIKPDFKNILRLKTTKSLLKFTDTYGVKCSKVKTDLHKKAKRFDYPFCIDWKKVAKKYDGIDIHYNGKADKLIYWYNGWDCSSGCIWHRRAVKKIKLLYTTKSLSK